MKQLFFCVVIFASFILLVSCDSDNDSFVDQSSAKTAEEFYDKLEQSYKSSNSTENLDRFFENWNKTVTSNSADAMKQKDVIAEIYNVYKEFYRPNKLSDLGDAEWGQSLNDGCKYFVVQNKVYYEITTDFDNDKPNFLDVERDSIVDFRPEVNLDNKIVLYLTPEYKTALNSFLGGKFTEWGTGSIMNPSQPTEESAAKFNVLRKYIPVLPGHWGGYWHIETHPEVSTIVLDTDFSKARVYFRIGYQGGESILEKVGEEWKLKESKLTWIE